VAGAQNQNLTMAERRKQREEERRKRQEEGSPPPPDEAETTPPGDEKAGARLPTEVAVGDLAFNPENPREELTHLDDLVETYRTVGMLQNLTIIPAATYTAAFPEHRKAIGDTPWVVLNGNRRLASGIQAKLSKVPVRVNTLLKERTEIAIAALVENIQREPLKPLEEATAIEKLAKELGSYAKVAKQLGKTEGWVSQRRRLANLVPEVRQAFEQGAPGMTIEVARDLGRIEDRDEQIAAWKEAERAAAERRAQPKKPKKRKVADPPGPSSSTTKDKTKADEEDGGGDGGDGSSGGFPQQNSGSGGGGQDQNRTESSLSARRSACVKMLITGSANPTPLLSAALQCPNRDSLETVALAEEWLRKAEIPTDVLRLPTPPGQSDIDRGVLALALATCEQHLTAAGLDDPAIGRVYLEWLVKHGAYQSATEAEQRIIDHVFTA
jgi:ParB/RepB/Spo0J family partition protein